MMEALNNGKSPRIWLFTDLQAVATCMWQSRLMLVNPAGSGAVDQWLLTRADSHSGLGIACSVVDINAQGTIKGLEEKMLEIHGLSGHLSSARNTFYSP